MNENTDFGLKLRDRALDNLAQAAREFANANSAASRVYHGPTLNERAALSLLRARLSELDEATAALKAVA